MQITIQHNDIEQAIKEFLANKGLTMEGKDVSVSFQTTRKGGPKVSAVVSFTDKAKAIPGYSQPDLTLVSSSAAELAQPEVAPESPAGERGPIAEEQEAHEQENQNAAAHQAEEDQASNTQSPSLFGG